MYKKHTSPLVRVVQGMPDSWERVVATANVGALAYDAVWSPCNRFIAVANHQSVELLDAVTLGQLCVIDTTYIVLDQQLDFSPDSRFLTLRMDEKFITWDLQTGGQLGIITSWVCSPSAGCLSFGRSEDGKMVAVAYISSAHSNDQTEFTTLIYTYDLLSGRRVGPHHIPEGQAVHPIWTQGEYFLFATIDPRSIRIWQSSFTSEHSPVEVESLPVPDGITDAHLFLFLPTLSRLAFILEDTIQVWDLKTLKLLLKSEPAPGLGDEWDIQLREPPCGSFTSDGRFFAYTNITGEVCVWKESPTGYLLHQRLPFFTPSSPRPRLSPNGESIIIPLNSKIHRWHTRDQDLSLPSVSTRDGSRRSFTLDFSADEKFAAFGRRKENTVTVIDLQSGEPRWIANVGVEIDCLGMAGSTVVPVGEEKIVTWNLPSEDSAFNASIDDSVRTTVLHHSPKRGNLGTPTRVSISPDRSRIMVERSRAGRTYPSRLKIVRSRPDNTGRTLEVDDVSTGLCLARVMTYNVMGPRFTQDEREVWAGYNFLSEKWEQYEIIEDGESGTIELKLQSTHHGPQSAFFRESSSGYAVTDDGWVLSPSQKRLLWLPHRWRSDEENRVWGGRFLGLLHGGELSKAVVLEFLE